MLLLTETMCRDERKGSCHRPIRAVVEWALGLLEAVKERNRNEAARVEHAEAILKSRYNDEYKAILWQRYGLRCCTSPLYSNYNFKK